MTIPESLIISVLPFPHPENDTEREINDKAESLYLGDEARENGANTSGLIEHPTLPGHVYYVAMGWTADGWRVFGTLFDEVQFVQFSETVREFSWQFAEDTKKRLFEELGIDPNADVSTVVGKLVDGLMARPACDDPECELHGPNANPEAIKANIMETLRQSRTPGTVDIFGGKSMTVIDLDDYPGNYM